MDKHLGDEIMEKDIIKTVEEKLVICEIYKQGGQIFIDFPNEQDTKKFELYGFLRMYLEIMEEQLLSEFELIK